MGDEVAKAIREKHSLLLSVKKEFSKFPGYTILQQLDELPLTYFLP